MTQMAEVEAILDDILSRWHHWSSSSRLVKGYASRSLVCGDFKISRQYDDSNGALDSDIENQTMKAVDFQISEMPEPFRSAIYCHARNLCTGVSIWSSPRLPQDREARAAIVVSARAMLSRRLALAGVL